MDCDEDEIANENCYVKIGGDIGNSSGERLFNYIGAKNMTSIEEDKKKISPLQKIFWYIFPYIFIFVFAIFSEKIGAFQIINELIYGILTSLARESGDFGTIILANGKFGQSMAYTFSIIAVGGIGFFIGSMIAYSKTDDS
ncbi:MAG: hypothetical protein KAH86_03845 [Methanosarcinales archaeon]|nr:hypothetical protein [Methanosarcinales archaeon]